MEINRHEYTNEFNKLMLRFANIFPSEPGYQKMQKYLGGLLGNAERKNGWQVAEYIGDFTPYSIQQFLYRGRFKADGLRDELRNYVSENLGEEDGVLVIDETGFLKQGKHSCGVKRQYSGTAGKVENCQIGTFLTYAGSRGHAIIDRRLYLPKEWTDDQERCENAGVPNDVKFETKPESALKMIKDATLAGVPYNWVTGDSVYGDDGRIRVWLEQEGKCYVMCVSGKAYVWIGCEQISISDILKNLPEEGWVQESCGDGTKGERLYDWLSVSVNPGTIDGFERSILIRRSLSSPDELRAFVCFAPTDTPKQKLAEIAGCRWEIETSFKECKSQVGLDQYEVRSYDGWYKHITLACIALAFLTILSVKSFDARSMQAHNPGSSSLNEFKKSGTCTFKQK